MNTFKVGDVVQLKPSVAKQRKERPTKKMAVIELFYSDIEGGVRLDRELLGFFSWNVGDLKKVKGA